MLTFKSICQMKTDELFFSMYSALYTLLLGKVFPKNKVSMQSKIEKNSSSV